MCDCYTAKCANCKCDIPLHIADFCTPKDTVIPYCPRCTKKIVRGKLEPPTNCQVFDDVAETSYRREGFHIRKGDKVKIYCKDKTAYGIHLN